MARFHFPVPVPFTDGNSISRKEGNRFERSVPKYPLASVSWLNRGTNKRSHYTRRINKSRQPIIRFDLRPQSCKIVGGRAPKPYLRATEYIILKISVRTIQEKASATPTGVQVNVPRTHLYTCTRMPH